MYAGQLDDIIQCQPILKKVYMGAYAKDKLPNLKNVNITTQRAYIINSAASEIAVGHWLLAYFFPKTKTVLWIDPYGHPPSFYGTKISKWLSQAKDFKLAYNNIPIQSPSSHYCGLFALFFMYFLSKGVGLKTILHFFSKTNLNQNDIVVSRFAMKRFKFNAKLSIL